QGIGGVIRDIIGCGLSAKPIANTDIFCFGNLDYSDSLPEGVFHPKRIFLGVVSGVRDYGNRMGIPTVNGAIVFDDGYLYNPLVYCGCLGIIPVDKIKKFVYPGEMIVLVGGKTGRDGIHGATFSSDALHSKLPTSVVQIGDPVTEKMFLDVILKARELNLFTAITDCGAGGLSSACGELTKDCGCKIYLEKVPLKYKGMLPWEIWLSESQERMVLIIDKNKVEQFIKLCQKEDVEATVIGEVTNTKKLEVYYNQVKVCDIDMEFLHNGLPKRRFNLIYKTKKFKLRPHQKIKVNRSIEEIFYSIISSPNVASKEWVIRQYDHEVQGNTIVKPLIGDINTGMYSPQDACVLYPVNVEGLTHTNKAIAISCGIKPSLSRINIERMTEYVIDEAIRNLICVGVNLNKIFLLDNFCWGELNRKNLAELFICCETAKNVAIKFATPFISGKDSLNNYYILGRKKKSIPSTLLISAVGIIEDIKNVKTAYFKSPDNCIFLIGKLEPNLKKADSPEYYKNFVLKPLNINLAKKIYKFINQSIDYILSMHDVSDGGMLTTIAELCFARNLGAEINFDNTSNIVPQLFCEPFCCIIAEVAKENKDKFEVLLKKEKIPYIYLGRVVLEPYIIVKQKGKTIATISVEKSYNLWSSGVSI
ncbi:MAG: AIR synthase-related protein, partial [Endomicrobia bacterium]|nr:AIR synthase-related protein [Endomicrobiia bacterium]